jgi:hypothetical protein
MLGGDPSSTVGVAHAEELLRGNAPTAAKSPARATKKR